MQNNYNSPMATASQINYLKRLGYTGPENITAAEANNIIQQLSKNNQQQAQNNNAGYQAPAPRQNYNVGNASTNEVKTIITKNGEEIQISREMIKAFLDVDLNPAEYSYFSSVCDLYGLNPYVKDIYAIKFGNQPATFIIDYKTMQQAADNDPSFDGLKTGLLYIDTKGVPQERDGAYLLPGEQLLGAWCEVYRKGRGHTNRTYAMYDENKKLTKEGKVNANWSDKPVFMITKVAKAQALRETFPNMFSNNTYTSDEIDDKPKFNADFTYDNETGVVKAQEEQTATIQPEVEEVKQKAPAEEIKKSTQDEIFAKHMTGIQQKIDF